MLVITVHPGYTAGQKLARVAKEVVTRAMDGTAKEGRGMMPQVLTSGGTAKEDGTAKEGSGGGDIYRILSVWAGGAGGMSSIHCATVL